MLAQAGLGAKRSALTRPIEMRPPDPVLAHSRLLWDTTAKTVDPFGVGTTHRLALRAGSVRELG